METAPSVLEPSQLLSPADELIIIRNPVSANSTRAQRQIADLQAMVPCGAIEVYSTLHDEHLSHEENRQANQQRVLNLLQERTNPNQPRNRRLWLALATGDGTIRDTAEAMLAADDAIRTVPILPLAGGNGNDFSSMVHGFWGKHRPAQQMHQAQVEPVQPLMLTVEHGGEQQVQYALSYISIGEIIARAAKTIDQDRGHNRAMQLVNEKLLAVRALATASQFTVAENGVTRQTSDLIFANGSRMAKFLRWDQCLGDPQFMRSEVSSKNLFAVALVGAQLALGKAPSTIVPDGEAVQFQTESDTMVQLDGEAFWLPGGSSVTVQRSQKSLTVVRLRKPAGQARGQ